MPTAMTITSRMPGRRKRRSGCSVRLIPLASRIQGSPRNHGAASDFVGLSAASARTLEPRLGHLAQVEDLVQLLLADTLRARELPDRLAGPHRLFGELGRLVVADDRVQRGRQHGAALDKLGSAVGRLQAL